MKALVLICVICSILAQNYRGIINYGFPVVCPGVNNTFTFVTNYFDNDTYTFDLNATISCSGINFLFDYVLGLVSYPSLLPDTYNFGFTSYLDLTNFTYGPYANNTISLSGYCNTTTITPNVAVNLTCYATQGHISPNYTIPVPFIDPNYNTVTGIVTPS